MKDWQRGLHKLIVLAHMEVDFSKNTLTQELFRDYNNCGKCNGADSEATNTRCKYFQIDWIESGGADMVCPHWEPK